MDFHAHKRTVLLVIAALALIVVILLVSFLNTYRKTASGSIISRQRVSDLAKGRIAPATADIGSISAWMTFDYVNHVFGLPQGYLSSTLGIADARYPKLTLGAYAKSRSVDAGAFTVEVENAVRGYSAALPPH